jgi:predicted DNA-binding transcriptional regulator AlpA
MELLLTTSQVCDKTGIRPSKLNYLVSDRRIPKELVIRRGSGQKRYYAPEIIDFVRRYIESKK